MEVRVRPENCEGKGVVSYGIDGEGRGGGGGEVRGRRKSP